MEKFLRFKAKDDCEGDLACGVEWVEVSESESRDVARLCMLKLWVNLEFIRANLVT